jgi:alpha-L-rhamnosidase
MLMKKIGFIVLLLLCIYNGDLFSQSQAAQWITTPGMPNKANTWMAFQKSVVVKRVPSKIMARIAVDSKYWLWVNGKMVVFEGGLKRGPTPFDTYYDEVNLSGFLKAGNNNIQLLVWYFGKDGFSHKSSGQAGLLFDCKAPLLSIVSDKSWQCRSLTAYQTAASPFPNDRLSEASILYDAGAQDALWRINSAVKMENAIEIGHEGAQPWNRLVARPIPLFKDFGLKNYKNQYRVHS